MRASRSMARSALWIAPSTVAIAATVMAAAAAAATIAPPAPIATAGTIDPAWRPYLPLEAAPTR